PNPNPLPSPFPARPSYQDHCAFPIDRPLLILRLFGASLVPRREAIPAGAKSYALLRRMVNWIQPIRRKSDRKRMYPKNFSWITLALGVLRARQIDLWPYRSIAGIPSGQSLSQLG